jgi:hypothetical protein
MYFILHCGVFSMLPAPAVLWNPFRIPLYMRQGTLLCEQKAATKKGPHCKQGDTTALQVLK